MTLRVVNLRRVAAAGLRRPRPKDRRWRCPACGVRYDDVIELRRGDEAPGTLAADQPLTGLCSVECAAAWYGLTKDGLPVCACGASVHQPGADCLDCQVEHGAAEDGAWVYDEELASHADTHADPDPSGGAGGLVGP